MDVIRNGMARLRRRRRGAVAIAAGMLALAAPAVGWAQGSPFYNYAAIRLSGGPAQLSEVRNSGTLPGTPTNRRDDDLIGLGGIALGTELRRFGIPIRTELEYNVDFRFDYNAAGLITPRSGPFYSNNIQTHTVMLNAYYDIDLGVPRWRPYVGAGVGWVHNISDADAGRVDSQGRVTIENRVDAKDGIAWSVGAGSRYDITPRLVAEAGFRYVSLGTIRSGTFADGSAVNVNEFHKYDFLVGLGYRF